VVVVVRFAFTLCPPSCHPHWDLPCLLYRFFSSLRARKVALWALRRRVLTVRQMCHVAACNIHALWAWRNQCLR
jgi:hypothetical protein